MPRLTQSEIHSDFSSASETWSEYRAQVIAFYDNYPHGELNDHITREFNKKIRDLGQAESLYISPYNAGLRYIGDGVFTVDPLSFNPYFYIDAASSMLGVLESPSLDLNPAVSSTLDIITATRAGTATYTDASGNIQTASPNTVRVDHVDGVPMILVEPAATNLVENTDFVSGWGLINATREVINIPSPLPSQNAIRLTNQNNIYGRVQDYVASSSDTTISVYVKRDGVDTRLRISSQNYGSSNFNVDESGVSIESNGGLGYDIQEHGDGWWRVSASFSGVGYAQFSSDNELGTRSVLLALPQVETGTVATSYIPTSGSAVTRAADNLDIAGSDFTNFYNTSEGTFYVEFTPKDLTDTETQYLLRGGGSNRRIIYSNGNVNNLRSYDGTNILIFSNAVESNSLHRVAVSFDSTTMKGSLDGATEVTSTHNGNLLTSTMLEVGANYNGHIKRVIYWPHHSDNI